MNFRRLSDFKTAFCVFGNRRGLRGVKLARGVERPPQAVAKKNAWEIFFEKDDLFSGGLFCFFFNRTGVLFLQ